MSDDEKRKSGSGSDDGEEDDYEVEEIRDKRRGEDGEWLYYVKWVGWESDTNTWEPIEHLEESKEILERFEQKWRRKQERKEERRREEKEQRKKERRERELKAAARFTRVDSDSDGGAAASEFIRKRDKEKKEKKRERERAASGSDSDRGSGDEKKREKERAERKQKQREKEREREKKLNGVDKDQRKSRDEEKKKEPVKPKFFRDIKPEKILGVTTGPGELYFYIQWEARSGVDPGLVTAKEAYQKIPQMCLKFYESHLIWNKPAGGTADKKEIKPAVDNVDMKESKSAVDNVDMKESKPIVDKVEKADTKPVVDGEEKKEIKPAAESLDKPDPSKAVEPVMPKDTTAESGEKDKGTPSDAASSSEVVKETNVTSMKDNTSGVSTEVDPIMSENKDDETTKEKPSGSSTQS